MRTELMRQPVASGHVAELQEDIDRHRRISLASCWLAGGYDLEPDDDEWESGWEDDLLSTD
jgi:hypothetical protein